MAKPDFPGLNRGNMWAEIAIDIFACNHTIQYIFDGGIIMFTYELSFSEADAIASEARQNGLQVSFKHSRKSGKIIVVMK